jgi:hypothetical protein
VNVVLVWADGVREGPFCEVRGGGEVVEAAVPDGCAYRMLGWNGMWDERGKGTG